MLAVGFTVVKRRPSRWKKHEHPGNAGGPRR
jgi:hypothetical protein